MLICCLLISQVNLSNWIRCLWHWGQLAHLFNSFIWTSMHLCMYTSKFCDYLQFSSLRSAHSSNLFEWWICLLANKGQSGSESHQRVSWIQVSFCLSVCLSVFLSYTLYYSLRASHLGFIVPILPHIYSVFAISSLFAQHFPGSFFHAPWTNFLFVFICILQNYHLSPDVIWWHPFSTIMHLGNS